MTSATTNQATLPRLILLTDRVAAGTRSRTLTETVREAVTGGARAVLLREKGLPRPERRRLLDTIQELLDSVGGIVGVASDVALAIQAGIGWVHLAQLDPLVDPDLHLIVGRSCHDTTETGRAAGEACAYVTMSPVELTSSKPGYGPALGVEGLAAAVRAAPSVRVFALGGVTPDNTADWLGAGAYGIAVMGSIMGARDPAAITASFLAALEGVV